MIQVTFPDKSQKSFAPGTTALEIAAGISPNLAKRAAAARVNGELVDLTRPLTEDVRIEIVEKASAEGREILSHDAAHVLAEAVTELFPEVHLTIGPAIENGFFYDIYRETPFTSADLEKIETRMREIVARDEKITCEEWTRDEAIAYYKKTGNKFKVEILEAIPADEKITFYRQGNFLDVCRGPHLPSTKSLGTAFKLTKLSGSYWRGDANNPQLQRIYGTAWESDEALKDYLHRLEEAEKRDHRKLGRQMDLFHLQEEAPGCVFWHPKGWTVFRLLQEYIRKKLAPQGYQEVNTPVLVSRKLWEASGHWEKFGHAMFTSETEGEVMAMKPMNCPCHVQIFKQGLKSYRDLPLRLAEFGCCHRYEPSGALHGLFRVRAFNQDDAHIFCTPDQIKDEIKSFCALLQGIYKDLGFDQFVVKFSNRPEVRFGDDATWDKAEAALHEGIQATGHPYQMNPGEGAFYGPKLEFVLKDAMGRDWQCGTIQVDMVLPERLGATYIGEDGQKHTPVMLHRAVLGSLERFTAILIEHYNGNLPFWLAPLQIVVTPITSDLDAYAQKVCTQLIGAGVRAETDLRAEKVSYKIREHSLQKVPVILVVGKKEAEDGTVTIRTLGTEAQETMALKEAVQRFTSASQLP